MGDPTPRPTALPVSPASIPDALKAFNQWVLWSWALVKGEWTKPPLSLRGGHASVTNSKTWTTYDKALTQYASGTVDGLGIVLTPQMELVGIDLDHCRNPDDGTIDAWAAEIVQDLCTYTEVSPSGTGLRLLMWGTLSAGGRKHGDVEMYCDRRYVTITGCHVADTSAIINNSQPALDAFHQRTFPPQEKTAPLLSHETVPVEDEVLLKRAFNAKNGSALGRLWAGDARGYPSASEADLGLCIRLAFWTRDPAQIDRLVHQSALLREKWDTPHGDTTYGQRTIAEALKRQTERWTPKPQPLATTAAHRGPPVSLAELEQTFQRWLYLPDLGPVRTYLGTIAANRLRGDPVWLMLIGGPGWGKTETLLSGARLPDIHIAATLTEASLLSGTRKKERSPEAKGGFLKQVGAFGFLILKDFTSVLSMNSDIRTGLLAALREIYDGTWTRYVGVDGGMALSWSGKLALIGGCTGTIDRYHEVIGAMGERFIFYRWPHVDEKAQAKRALQLLGKEAQMRAELADIVSRFFAGITFPDTPESLGIHEQDRLVALASLAVRCRSAVQRHAYSREIELIPDPEAPGRLTLTLARLYAGLRAVTISESEAWDLIVKIAFDCLPALRWKVLQYLIQSDDKVETSEVATALDYPTQTTRRTLEDLAAHHILTRHKGQKADLWNISDWTWTLYNSAIGKE